MTTSEIFNFLLGFFLGALALATIAIVNKIREK